MFFLAGDPLDRVTTFARRFVGFDAGTVRRVVGNGHRSAAARLCTGQMLMLKGLNKPAMSLPFLFRFHHPSFPERSLLTKERLQVGPIAQHPLLRGECVGLTCAHAPSTAHLVAVKSYLVCAVREHLRAAHLPRILIFPTLH